VGLLRSLNVWKFNGLIAKRLGCELTIQLLASQDAVLPSRSKNVIMCYLKLPFLSMTFGFVHHGLLLGVEVG
jgi:hypothetical protein